MGGLRFGLHDGFRRRGLGLRNRRFALLSGLLLLHGRLRILLRLRLRRFYLRRRSLDLGRSFVFRNVRLLRLCVRCCCGAHAWLLGCGGRAVFYFGVQTSEKGYRYVALYFGYCTVPTVGYFSEQLYVRPYVFCVHVRSYFMPRLASMRMVNARCMSLSPTTTVNSLVVLMTSVMLMLSQASSLNI